MSETSKPSSEQDFATVRAALPEYPLGAVPAPASHVALNRLEEQLETLREIERDMENMNRLWAEVDYGARLAAEERVRASSPASRRDS